MLFSVSTMKSTLVVFGILFIACVLLSVVNGLRIEERKIKGDKEKRQVFPKRSDDYPCDGLICSFSEGVLTIKGEGRMKNYSSSDFKPWDYNISSLNSIVVEDGVLSIGYNAFCELENLVSLTLSKTVQTYQ